MTDAQHLTMPARRFGGGVCDLVRIMPIGYLRTHFCIDKTVDDIGILNGGKSFPKCDAELLEHRTKKSVHWDAPFCVRRIK